MAEVLGSADGARNIPMEYTPPSVRSEVYSAVIGIDFSDLKPSATLTMSSSYQIYFVSGYFGIHAPSVDVLKGERTRVGISLGFFDHQWFRGRSPSTWTRDNTYLKLVYHSVSLSPTRYWISDDFSGRSYNFYDAA
jgi:hypothetical protein